MLGKSEYYTYPQEEWNEKKCKREARQFWKDGMGTKIHFRGYIGSSATIGGYGKKRFNGGCQRPDYDTGDWYEGQIRPLPKVTENYVIVVIPSWGWRIRHIDDTDTIKSEKPVTDPNLGQQDTGKRVVTTTQTKETKETKMNDSKVLVSQKLMDSLRLLLIKMAQTDDRPPSERNIEIEKPRQFCEGYLGIKRKELASLNQAEVDEVLHLTGFLPTE